MINGLKLQILVLFFIASLACSLLAKPTEVAYLIPEGFTGGVTILYNQKDGITPEITKDGKIIYEIPEDGFLKIKNKFERKHHKYEYYFIDDKGNRKEIEYLHPEAYVRDPGDTTSKSFDSITEEERMNQVFVISHETKNFTVNKIRVYMQSFILETPKDSLKTYMKNLDRMSEIQIKMLRGEWD